MFKLLIKYSSKLQITMHVGGAHYTDTNEHLSIWNFIMCKTENELFIRICVQMKNVQIELNCYFFQHVHARKSLSFSHKCKRCVCVCVCAKGCCLPNVASHVDENEPAMKPIYIRVQHRIITNYITKSQGAVSLASLTGAKLFPCIQESVHFAALPEVLYLGVYFILPRVVFA